MLSRSNEEILIMYPDDIKVDELYNIFNTKLHNRSIKMILEIDEIYMNVFHIFKLLLEFGFDGIVMNIKETTDYSTSVNKFLVLLDLLNKLNAPYNEYKWSMYLSIDHIKINMNKSPMINWVDYPGSSFVKMCMNDFILEIIDCYFFV